MREDSGRGRKYWKCVVCQEQFPNLLCVLGPGSWSQRVCLELNELLFLIFFNMKMKGTFRDTANSVYCLMQIVCTCSLRVCTSQGYCYWILKTKNSPINWNWNFRELRTLLECASRSSISHCYLISISKFNELSTQATIYNEMLESDMMYSDIPMQGPWKPQWLWWAWEHTSKDSGQDLAGRYFKYNFDITLENTIFEISPDIMRKTTWYLPP